MSDPAQFPGASSCDTFESVLNSRYSCRAFRPEPLERALIERILSLAQRTPSWCNAQPWQVAITSGAGTERLREGFLEGAGGARRSDLPFPETYVGVYKERRRACGLQLYESVGVGGDRQASAKQSLENYRLFGAPHLAVVTTDRSLGVYGVLDCGAYVTTFLLAARSLGVAAIAQAALVSQSDFLRRALRLQDDRVLVCGISFGLEEETHPANAFRTPREEIANVVQWMDA
ncbi:nitroreductase [Phenylobacterium sp. J367]|uniref:nitroreductase n=2 Tax=unclassified Phenylobacterium TaxID=2640670 RepID=UPI00215115F0|nr:nitroreductase [Phenylobacterium sp. J367]MCR5879847.1 nitroreductase [Phenylobacterium sp. J367]